ncbi:MAG TPA: prepilin peptidase [Pyrinomonadaceae bacterium]|nr:prepilin peptidase [Pyrinomonadaceae bacterium]
MSLLAIENYVAVPLPIACTFAGILGAIIGSFLNVVIHRVPREESIVFPNSACPSCHTALRPYDNIPILSFLVLRGRCRFCRKPISIRYPIVETLTAFLFVAVALHDGTSFALPFDLAFVAALLALIFIDAEHMILPNVITYPGILFAILTRIALPYLVGATVFDDLPGLLVRLPNLPLWSVSLIGAALGALVGGGSLWLMGFIWEKLRGVEAMGLGDVKMMLMVGGYLGWRLAGLTIFAGVLSGSLIGIGVMMKRGRRDMQMMLPFGIFLGIGAIACLFFGHYVVEWYGSQFIR